jgi:hypothetical protein
MQNLKPTPRQKARKTTARKTDANIGFSRELTNEEKRT